MPRLACSALLLLPLATAPSAAQQPPDTAWTAREVMIPMRDGVRLHTYVVTPRHAAEPLPILMQRTPYGASGGVRGFLDANRFLAADGYVFVFQDIRGRNGSEGDYLMNRPLRSDSTGVDEATDTYDTIEWLLANVPNTTGRVGGFGISYPGWLATMQALSGHPALRAVSPQAPMTDTWMGDDFFHQGAFPAQPIDGSKDKRPHPLVQPLHKILLGDANPEAFDVTMERMREVRPWDLRGGGVQRVVTANGV